MFSICIHTYMHTCVHTYIQSFFQAQLCSWISELPMTSVIVLCFTMFCLAEYDGIHRRMKINLMETVSFYHQALAYFGTSPLRDYTMKYLMSIYNIGGKTNIEGSPFEVGNLDLWLTIWVIFYFMVNGLNLGLALLYQVQTLWCFLRYHIGSVLI